ncbi:copper resistance protein CopC [Streptomyces griseus]|uniref:copper resistance protein CopC n=1 Tax=Streptomyces griseus TaxID=1911 RepID=UPI00055C645C|nr:copper resistance protein CopC [Streptomyces griseus]
MLLGAMLVLLVLGGAGPASAHAALRDTDPADGAVLKTAPRALTLTFTESIGLLDDSLRVLDPDNRRADRGEPRHASGRSDTVQVSLPANATEGTYVVAWRVVSADSHPVSGAFTYSVGKPSPTPVVVSAGPVENRATGSLYDLARYLAYGAAALFIGTAVFLVVCRPPEPGRLRRTLVVGWWVLLAATAVLLLLRAPYESGTGPASAFDPSALKRTLTTRPGEALVARLLLLPVAAVLLLRARKHERPTRVTLGAGAVLGVGLALTWASAEHASAGIQVPVAMTSSVLHLLAMAAWLGGLTALLTLLHRGPLPALTVARFSRLAFTSVIVLTVTGVYQSWRGLGSWATLTETAYGRILLVKLAAVTLLLAAAGWSRRWTGRLVAAEAATESGAEKGTESGAEKGTESGAEKETEVAVKERVPAKVGGAAEAETREDASGAPGGSGTADASGAPGGSGTAEASGAPGGSGTAEASGAPGGSGTSEASGALGRSGIAEASGGPEEPPAEDAHRKALRRSVLVEVAVSVLVLMITTVLTNTLPGRAAAEASTTASSAGAGTVTAASVTNVPFEVGKARGRVQVTLESNRAGDNSVEAIVFGPDGSPAIVPEVRVTFTLASQRIGPLDTRVTDKGGYWGADSFNLPIPGTWEMKVTVRVSEVDQVSETKQVRIQP